MTGAALRVHDARACQLGEGPLWHPERGALFWFDILGQRMLSGSDLASGSAGPAREWAFDATPSAAGWTGRDTLVVAVGTRLLHLDLETGAREPLCEIGPQDAGLRTNDGRADPAGGFWIGTMGTAAETGAGAIHRYYRGEVRLLYRDISIPNAICFAPGGETAHFADSARRKVWRVGLDAQGWPRGEPEVFLDLSDGVAEPDGAVVDAAGTLWLAEWGAGCVSAWDPDGTLRQRIAVGAPFATCPAFGGADLSTLFVTSARRGMTPETLASHPDAGCTFALDPGAAGQREHKVILA